MQKYLSRRNLIIAAVVVILLIIGIAAIPTHTPPATMTHANATTPPSPAAASATPASVFDATKATGAPTVGATMQNFVKRYGQPINFGTGNSPNFTDQGTILNVRYDAHGIVTYLGVLGPVEWDTYQTMIYCIQFLPNQAVVSNVTGNLTNYRTVVGQVIINNPGQGTCTVYLGT